MPATLEAPAKGIIPDLPPLEAAFKEALVVQEAKEEGTPPPVKEPVKEPVSKEPAKEPSKEPSKEPVKEVAGKKKSALDAALSDDGVIEQKVDEFASESEEVRKALSSEEAPADVSAWKKARTMWQTTLRENRELKQKMEKGIEPPVEVVTELKTLKTEREKLTAENAKLRDSIIALDVRFDPEVQERIAGRDRQATTLADRVGEAGGNKEAFLAALDMPLSKRGKALDAALEGIESQRELATINTKLGQIEVTDEQLEEQLSKPHESFEQLKQKREIAAREHVEQVERFKAATYEKVQRDLPKLSKLMRMAPEDAEGASEYNASLKADLERAPGLLNVPPEEATLLTFKAARYDSAEKMVLASRARISELEAELAKYEGAEPGFRGGGKSRPKADHERPIEEVFREALEGKSV